MPKTNINHICKYLEDIRAREHIIDLVTAPICNDWAVNEENYFSEMPGHLDWCDYSITWEDMKTDYWQEIAYMDF